MCGTGFDEAQLECEEAIARLRECCPDLKISELRCHNEGCDEATSPTLSLDESKCILNETCDAITSATTCRRTEEAAAAKSQSYGATQSTSSSRSVCP